MTHDQLRNLEKDPTIVIKPVDKGGNLVIMDHTQYLSMCLTLLSDRDAYKILDRDLTDTYCTELITILKMGLDN